MDNLARIKNDLAFIDGVGINKLGLLDPMKMYSFNFNKVDVEFDPLLKKTPWVGPIEPQIRDKVFAAEEFLKEQPQVNIKLIHHFSKGVYAREIHIPANVILTGEIHKFQNLNILSKGRMQVLTENGIEEVEAPFTVVSPAGTKRIAYTLTDCVWTTVHGTDLINVDDIEKIFIAKSEQEWLEFCGINQLELGI